jgi:hypothetical protein
MFDTLITVTILTLVVARNARWWSRWPRWLLLLVLLAGAAAASLQRATRGYAALPDDPLKAGVAVAPHVMLLLAIWLWLTMFRQARNALARRPATADASPPASDGPPPPAEDRPDVPGLFPDDAPATGPQDLPGPDSDAAPGPDSGAASGPPDLSGPSREPDRLEPWVTQEAPLDWALVPYDSEPAPPYDPDPAVRPYDPEPVTYEKPQDTYESPVTYGEPGPGPVTYEKTDPEPGAYGEPDPSAYREPYGEPIAYGEPAAEPAAPTGPVPAASLPTDVKLVGRPAATTQPDIVMPDLGEPYAEPPRIPSPASAGDDADDDGAGDVMDVPVVDRAEDPDAGDDHPVPGYAGGPSSATEDVERWSAEAAEDVRRWSEDATGGLGEDRPGPERAPEVEWRPPSSTFRSSPTPPDDE